MPPPLSQNLLLAAAQAAAGAQQYPAGSLYMVATPIGNLADLSLRAIQVLSLVDAVACEDTRVSGGLLTHLGLDRPLMAVHEHNEQAAAQAVIARLARGERVAYVSDAGTPALSDPGALLCAAVQAAGHRVLPIPGASSALAALSVAGDVARSGFHFVGFLPARSGERKTALQALAGEPATQIVFEAPHRIEDLVSELAERMPERRVSLCRELTKQFETVHTDVAASLPAWMAGDAHRKRGEFVLVVHALPAVEVVDDPIDPAIERTLVTLMAELPLKQAVGLAASLSGAPRNLLYERALALRDAAE